MKRKIFLFFLFSYAVLVNAQTYHSGTDSLNINQVFETYGKSEDCTMIEIQNDDDYEFSYYKSIVVSNNPKAVALAKACVEKDKQQAQSIKEVYTGGEPRTIYLNLGKKGAVYRFILFNYNKAEKTTLIYLESDKKDILKIILKSK